MAGMSDAGFVVLRPGCSRRIVFVRRRRSRTRSACRGLRCCPHWVGRLCACCVWVSGCRVVASVRRGRFSCRGVLCASLSCCQVCWDIGGRLLLCCGARTPSWWGVLRCCVAHLMAGRGVVVYGPPHGGACCGRVWPPSWWGVLRWCVAPLMMGRGVVLWAPHMLGNAVVVCSPPYGGAWCGGVWSRAWWGVVCWRVAPCWWGVVWWCVAPLMVGRAALMCGLPHGGACCVGVRRVVLCGVVCCGGVWPPHGGACHVGLSPPSWWGVVFCVVSRRPVVCCVALRCVVWWWCVAPLLVGLAAFGCGVLCCVVLCCVWWCVAPRMVGRAVLVCAPPLWWVRGVLAGSMLCLFCWFAVVPATLRPALSGVGCPCCLPGRDGWAGLGSACGAPSLFGHGLGRFSLLGHGLVRLSLPGHGLGRDHLSLRQDYFSLGWDNVTGMCSHRTRDSSLCALTLRPGSRSLHVTSGISLSNFLTQTPSSMH